MYAHNKLKALFVTCMVGGALVAADQEKPGCLQRCKQRLMGSVCRKEVLIPAANGALYLAATSALDKAWHERLVLAVIGAGYGHIGTQIAFGEGKKAREE